MNRISLQVISWAITSLEGAQVLFSWSAMGLWRGSSRQRIWVFPRIRKAFICHSAKFFRGGIEPWGPKWIIEEGKKYCSRHNFPLTWMPIFHLGQTRPACSDGSSDHWIFYAPYYLLLLKGKVLTSSFFVFPFKNWIISLVCNNPFSPK